MIGKIKIDNLCSIVEPLSAIEKVLSDGDDGAHIVYEFEDDKIFIGARNSAGARAIYELEADKVFEDYKNPNTEIGIWDVVDFVNKLSLFDGDFTLTHDKNLIEATNDSDSVQFYGCDPSEIKKGSRKLKTSALDVGASLTLQNTHVVKLRNAIRSYTGQDIMILKGDSETGELTVSIVGDVKRSNSYKTVIKGVNVENDFEMKFMKNEISKVLSCTDEFDVTIYCGSKEIVEFNYSKDYYDMKFYIIPDGE